jgi:hypothetical protein
MATKSRQFYQDENHEDFALPWEPDESTERTEEGFIACHDELIVLVKHSFMDLLEVDGSSTLCVRSLGAISRNDGTAPIGALPESGR